MEQRVFVLVIITMFIMIAAISGCAKKATPVLRIGTNAEYPPFESKEGDAYIGVDMDLARKIAEKLEMEYQIIDMDFDTLIPSLSSNKIDMAISAISITDERQRQVDFSEPYYVANQVIIKKQDNPVTLENIGDIARFKVGSMNSTTGQAYITENFVDKNLMKKDAFKRYPTNIEAINDLLNGNVDFVIIDDSAAQGYARLKPISIALKIETNESYGIAMPKGSPLNAKINEALKDLIDSGEVVSIIQAHIK